MEKRGDITHDTPQTTRVVRDSEPRKKQANDAELTADEALDLEDNAATRAANAVAQAARKP